MSNVFLGTPIITVTGVSITTSGTSASATVPNDSAGNLPRYVRIAATAAAYVRFGKTTATAITTDMLIQPGDSQVVALPGGCDKVAAIQVLAAGQVQVSPLDNS